MPAPGMAEEVKEEAGSAARRLERLRLELQDCQLGASWLFTTVGAFTGTAAGIYLKRMQPLFAFGIVGTCFDMLNMQSVCADKNEALQAALQAAAEEKGNGSG